MSWYVFRALMKYWRPGNSSSTVFGQDSAGWRVGQHRADVLTGPWLYAGVHRSQRTKCHSTHTWSHQNFSRYTRPDPVLVPEKPCVGVGGQQLCQWLPGTFAFWKRKGVVLLLQPGACDMGRGRNSCPIFHSSSRKHHLKGGGGKSPAGKILLLSINAHIMYLWTMILTMIVHH